jgi:hypothetical protein
MKRVIRFCVLGIIALVFIGTLVFLYKKSHQSTVVYQLDSPARMSIVKKTVAIGKVIPRREIEVKAQVSGVVEKLYVTAGQTVRKGDIIARISLRPRTLQEAACREIDLGNPVQPVFDELRPAEGGGGFRRELVVAAENGRHEEFREGFQHDSGDH